MRNELMNTNEETTERSDRISLRSLTTPARRFGIVAGAFLALLIVAVTLRPVATADIASPAEQTATMTAPQDLHPVPTRIVPGEGVFIGVLLVVAAVIMTGRKKIRDIATVLYRESRERSNA
jgi:hypothetical protein